MGPHVARAEDIPPLVQRFDCSLDTDPALLTDVRRTIVKGLLGGERRSLDEVAATVPHPTEQVHRLLDAMVAADALELEGELVVGAAGMTLTETPHSFSHGGRTLHGWCALDVVAIPMATCLDAVASTICPVCGSSRSLVIEAGRPISHGEVVWVPNHPLSCGRSGFCSTANLYCDVEHARSWWTSAGTPEGLCVPPALLTELARAAWGDLTPVLA